MEKFSLEFKKVVSEKYLEGELSLKSVARMYGISPCTVVKEVVDDGFSVREVTVKHGIPAFGTVCNWLEKYRKYIAKMLSFEKIKIVFLCRIKAPFQHHHYQH
ncbi:ISRSO11-transposase orfA protein [Escherichia coli]|nr:hypothetical protein [Escherichia coli]MDF7200823.1 transposase [Escherichia coli]CTR52913.1 ISRSO11-transposase orfA protein [Escherichia coli]CTX40554.1 ISRSO11-transposase orfA protein [Escherichia coli]CTX61941.1 ISRSO11-transposase orfA protein [Escherichia coli]CUA39009.1 ISRSO11-transposase orfA protein [Escherichia coli]